MDEDTKVTTVVDENTPKVRRRAAIEHSQIRSFSYVYPSPSVMKNALRIHQLSDITAGQDPAQILEVGTKFPDYC